ncbi:hypothetical protein PENSPDRAFT_730556 [Peniophora sp. CONT]|nr:hypothetical protein PENSPDRAFT_730556 [Peniophora sp. CONT]
MSSVSRAPDHEHGVLTRPEASGHPNVNGMVLEATGSNGDVTLGALTAVTELPIGRESATMQPADPDATVTTNVIIGLNGEEMHLEAPMEEEDPEILAYTYACAHVQSHTDPRGAGYGVHWAMGRPEGVPGDLSRRCAGGRTNNYAELVATIRVLELTATDPRSLTMVTDSKYSHDCFDWVKGWRQRGWRNTRGQEIMSIDMIRYMVALRQLRAGPTTLRLIRSDDMLPGGRRRASRSSPWVEAEAEDNHGYALAERLAQDGARLPETDAEGETDEDWARLRAGAERKVEERNGGENSPGQNAEID